jgi:enoyl-CoA hydratase/carnithine racemase
MQHLQLLHNDGLLNIQMARAKANALNSELLGELHEALRGAADDPAVRGVVLSSVFPGIFSAGFDAREIFPYDGEQIRGFFVRFVEVCHSLLDLPKPVVAAIEGHAIAGGAILALACDLRVMGEGDYGFAVNEINLGLVLSQGVLQMAVGAMGAGPARELILDGVTIGPQRAHAIGLATELAPAGQTLARAEARARGLAEKPPLAFAAVKRLFREQTVLPLEREIGSLNTFVQHWVSEESRERRNRLAAALRK